MICIQKLIREPVVIFILLGALFYGVMAAFRPADAQAAITIRPETIRAALQNDADLTGTKASAERRDQIIQGLIGDEVLLREAYSLGYDKNDSRVRKRLLNIMRTSIMQTIPDPSATQLEKYYRNHLDQFRTEGGITFEQVFFSFSNEKPPVDPEDYVEALNAGMPTDQLGDYLQMSSNFPRQTRNRLVLIFGRDFADDILAMEPGAWHGALQSKHGIHYVRIKEVHPAKQQTYEQVEPFLRQQWQFDEQRKQQQVGIDTLRKKYEIILPDEYAD